MKHCWLTILSAVVFFSALGVHQGLAQSDERDPFGVDEDEWFSATPVEAEYWRGVKRVEKNEIMVRSLTNVWLPLENLPLVDRGLAKLPQTSPTDKVYDVSSCFPNCKGNQWVYYNRTSDYLIAKASHRLRASVNDYVHRMLESLPMKARLSVTYLMVEGNVPLNIEALKQSKHRRLMSFSGEFRSGEKVIFGKGVRQVSTEVILGARRLGADVLLNLHREGEFDVELIAYLEAGEERVVNLGISEGDERGVIILNLECLDMKGRIVKQYSEKRVGKHSEGRHFINGDEYLFFRFPDFIRLIGPVGASLIVPPELDFFDKDDVTYDLKETMELQGLKFDEDDWVIYDFVTERLIACCNHYALEQLEELILCLCYWTPSSLSTMTNFYEVDAKPEGVEDWGLLDVLAGEPVLLGRVGFLQFSGERVRHGSQQGSAMLEVIMDATGYMNEQLYRIDLNLLGRKIKSELELMIAYDKLTFIELQTDPLTKRSIVMMIITKKQRATRY